MKALFSLMVFASMLLGCSKNHPRAELDSQKPLSARQKNTEPETPRHRFEVLKKEYDVARDAYSNAWRAAHDDPTKRMGAEEQREQMLAFAARFFGLSEQYPGDPVAFDARAVIVSTKGQERFEMDDEVRALDELVRNHVDDPRIASFCPKMQFLSRTANGAKGEQMLRDVIAKNTLPEVQAQANFNLAVVIQDWAQFAHYFQGNPTDANWIVYRNMFGEELLAKLRDGDADKLDEEAARLYTHVIEQPAGVQDAKGKLEEQAKGQLFAIRNLSIGRVAPDIVGVDLDGKPIKLSHFRGKVIVLTFWATWCGSCMALVPWERDLVTRLKNRPFALIGVNCDSDRQVAKNVATKEEMSWRSFSDGDWNTGPIVTKWGINSWPTVYVLDAKGVIRFKNVDFPIPNKGHCDETVEALLTEAKPE
jgi:thiol-disulfide isomerase/thioredoxin